LKVLDFDPGLADGLDPEQFTAARHRVLAASALLKPTSQDFDWAWGRERSERSLLIVGGLMVRRLTIDGRCCSEIVGPGDVVRPWDGEVVSALPVPASVRWRIIEPTRVVLIDERFLATASAWPAVLGELVRRAVRRAQSLAVHLTLCSKPRVDERLLLLFWHLADRWGTVTPTGVRVELPLTHELLAELVGALRPTVTTALVGLSGRGLVLRDGADVWRLPHGLASRAA
jgi:CRP-like cAMP-binding protein